MKSAYTANFLKVYKKLPKAVQRQVDKQIAFLEKNFFHSSLNTKKMSGYQDWWEFRVSKGYRMAGKKVKDTIVLHTVGPHDKGLGLK